MSPIEISTLTGVPDQFLTLEGKVLSQSDEAKAQAEAGRQRAKVLMMERDGNQLLQPTQAPETPDSLPRSPAPHSEVVFKG